MTMLRKFLVLVFALVLTLGVLIALSLHEEKVHLESCAKLGVVCEPGAIMKASSLFEGWLEAMRAKP